MKKKVISATTEEIEFMYKDATFSRRYPLANKLWSLLCERRRFAAQAKIRLGVD